jgi:hypothetical protein
MQRFQETGLWREPEGMWSDFNWIVDALVKGETSYAVEEYVVKHFPIIVREVEEKQKRLIPTEEFFARMRWRLRSGKGKVFCKDYLDQTFPGWQEDHEEQVMLKTLEQALVCQHFD